MTIVILTYKIQFNDADDGWCFAGDGQRILLVTGNREAAKRLCAEWNPIIALAEQETVVFPVQKYNKMLRRRFGITLDSVDQYARDFKLVAEEHELECLDTPKTNDTAAS